MSTLITVSTPGASSARHRDDPEPAVRRGSSGDAPEQFIWDDRLHVVRTVLGHSTTGRVEEWRVLAAAGQHAAPQVFVLRFDWASGRWTVQPDSSGTAGRTGVPG
jgi:hypothetical protein